MQKPADEFVRVEDMSKSLSAFARQIAIVQFKAIHPGLGLGGALLSDFARNHPSVADISPKSQSTITVVSESLPSKVSEDFVEESESQIVSFAPAKITKPNRSSPRWFVGVLGFACDWFLAIAGILAAVGMLHTADDQFLDGIFRVIPWENYSLWSIGAAAIFGVFLLYWLCFLLVVGGTPGQKFAKRYFSRPTRKNDLPAKAMSLK